MKPYNIVDTYVDTLGFRIVCNSQDERNYLFKEILDFISMQKIVGIVYDKERSNQYYQTTKLQYANSTLATISKGFYENSSNGYLMQYYYININFYGLKRYNKTKDDASRRLIRTVAAHLNTEGIYFRLIELDIAMDIRSNMDNVLVVCTRRSANIDYFQLGDVDIDGNKIQAHDGTYYIEKFKSRKKEKNAVSRAYLYNKRLKEQRKFKRDIGFELTRFEVKLQKRYFVKNKYCTGVMHKTLDKYTVLQFRDTEYKERLIQTCNGAKNGKERKKLIAEALSNGDVTLLRPRMDKVGSYLREIDTVKFNTYGGFTYTKQEDYLYAHSKFNYKH